MNALAVLLALDGSERVITVPEPPLATWLVAVLPKYSVKQYDESLPFLPEHRTFYLSAEMRSPTHKWMRLYNQGRSMTPEPAYVYVEKK